MNEKQEPERWQQPTDEIRRDVRALIVGARHAAIATLSPDTGAPQCTRVGLATLPDGTPLIFVSALAAHTPALLADPRCSLLIGEPGKGDPLVHPRITLSCQAELIDSGSNAVNEARASYLTAHPKAHLYADLPDFRFFRLVPSEGRYNGGFGKAYVLQLSDKAEDLNGPQ